MVKKKTYLCPKISSFVLDSEIMETVPWSPSPGGADAQKNDFFFDESAEDEDNTAETGSLWDEPMWQ